MSIDALIKEFTPLARTAVDAAFASTPAEDVITGWPNLAPEAMTAANLDDHEGDETEVRVAYFDAFEAAVRAEAAARGLPMGDWREAVAEFGTVDAEMVFEVNDPEEVVENWLGSLDECSGDFHFNNAIEIAVYQRRSGLDAAAFDRELRKIYIEAFHAVVLAQAKELGKEADLAPIPT